MTTENRLNKRTALIKRADGTAVCYFSLVTRCCAYLRKGPIFNSVIYCVKKWIFICTDFTSEANKQFVFNFLEFLFYLTFYLLYKCCKPWINIFTGIPFYFNVAKARHIVCSLFERKSMLEKKILININNVICYMYK